MVAEKRRVCLSSGVSLSILVMSSTKPMSSISSASSRTTTWTYFSFRVPLSIWSITLPGVPTTTWTPFLRAFICLSIDVPPYMGSAIILLNFPSLFISSATCTASSLVGVSIMAWTLKLVLSSLSIIGIPNAAVFPVPVCACPTTSLPLIRTGMVFPWMGVGSSKPIAEMAFNISLLKPSSLNVVIFSSNFFPLSFD